jgi:hypothetical protein
VLQVPEKLDRPLCLGLIEVQPSRRPMLQIVHMPPHRQPHQLTRDNLSRLHARNIGVDRLRNR